MSYEQLTGCVAAAIPASVSRILERRPSEHLVGYALLVDDALSTLHHVGCTRESLEELAVDGGEVMPELWRLPDGRETFDEARVLLAQLHRQARTPADRLAHCNEAFAALVAALAEARLSGVLGEDVVLIVANEDASRSPRLHEADAVARLNSPPVVAAWRRASGLSG